MRVLVIGGGVAGMSCALQLRRQGDEPIIVERDERLGGKVGMWHKLFPDLQDAHSLVSQFEQEVRSAGIEVLLNGQVDKVEGTTVTLADNRMIQADRIVMCTGYDLFDARRKEEYGYGIYDNVFTTVDIERMLNSGKVCTAQGTEPRRIAFLHCVGSRDEKVGNSHCSKVCCITGIKQAMELKEMFPRCDVYNFYMDIRMFGPGYEEMYRKAQIESGIHFVRGRISEASPTIDNRIQIKAEDTLIGRPMKMTVDMFILIVGMQGNALNNGFAQCRGVEVAENGFLKPRDPFRGNVLSDNNKIFYAGASTAPKTIGESINEGIAAAVAIHNA